MFGKEHSSMGGILRTWFSESKRILDVRSVEYRLRNAQHTLSFGTKWPTPTTDPAVQQATSVPQTYIYKMLPEAHNLISMKELLIPLVPVVS